MAFGMFCPPASVVGAAPLLDVELLDVDELLDVEELLDAPPAPLVDELLDDDVDVEEEDEEDDVEDVDEEVEDELTPVLPVPAGVDEPQLASRIVEPAIRLPIIVLVVRMVVPSPWVSCQRYTTAAAVSLLGFSGRP